MKSAPIPKNEKDRLVSLHRLALLDTKPEKRFDRITLIATKIFKAPISTLTLIDNKREWFKSVCGLNKREGDRATSFCGHALLANKILVVNDTKKDKRFFDNPMVVGKPYIRFYAGVPILSSDGERIGVFCIKDVKPRKFSKSDKEMLQNLASWVEVEVNSFNLSQDIIYGKKMRAKEAIHLRDLDNVRIAARNVLEDLQAEKEKIIELKAKEDAMIRSIGEGLIATDEKGKIIFLNRIAENLLGWKSKEVEGDLLVNLISIEDEWNKLVPEEERPIHVALTNAIDTNKSAVYYYVKKDKTKLPVLITATSILLEGKVIGAIEVFRDITKEKEVEKIRNDFLLLASHQLRTPLSGTKWMIETMQREVVGQLNQKQKEYLDHIYQSNERMIKLVFDMLNVLRFEGGFITIDKKDINIFKFYENILTITDAAAKSRNVILKIALSDNKIGVESDAMILQNIIECFVANAINYSGSGKEVILDAKEEDNEIILSVKDNGIGIPREEQDKIFERFYRASNAKEIKPDGTGLGLHMSLMLSEKIKGKVYFESKESEGSTFYLKIPKKINDNK